MKTNHNKIVIINTSDISGGAAIAAYRLHLGLSRIGESSRMIVKNKMTSDESVICAPYEINDKKEFQNQVDYNNYISSHRTGLSDTLFSYPDPGYDLSKIPYVQKSDIINLHWICRYQSLLNLHNLFKLGTPVVWTLHDQWPFTGGCHYTAGCEKYRYDCSSCPQLTEDIFDLPSQVLKEKQRILKNANLTIVTPSQWLAKCAKESSLLGNFRIKVIPNSIDTEIFTPISKSVAKEKIGIKANTITILFCAERILKKRKGFQEFINAFLYCLSDTAFKDLVESGRVKLLCIGDSNKNLNNDNIPLIQIGHLNSEKDLREAYSAAEMFVLPSLEDNLPNTILEAMSCGTPVVAFDVGGVPDIVSDNVTGRIVPKGDVTQLGEAILYMVVNSDRRKSMEKSCRNHIVDQYSLKKQAQQYTDLFN